MTYCGHSRMSTRQKAFPSLGGCRDAVRVVFWEIECDFPHELRERRENRAIIFGKIKGLVPVLDRDFDLAEEISYKLELGE